MIAQIITVTEEWLVDSHIEKQCPECGEGAYEPREIMRETTRTVAGLLIEVCDFWTCDYCHGRQSEEVQG